MICATRDERTHIHSRHHPFPHFHAIETLGGEDPKTEAHKFLQKASSLKAFKALPIPDTARALEYSSVIKILSELGPRFLDSSGSEMP